MELYYFSTLDVSPSATLGEAPEEHTMWWDNVSLVEGSLSKHEKLPSSRAVGLKLEM